MLHLYKSLVVVATACIIIRSLYDQKKRKEARPSLAAETKTTSSGKGANVTTDHGMVIWIN